MQSCKFCQVLRESEGQLLYRDEVSAAFLDIRPLFPGHTLVIPTTHCETLAGVPGDLLAPFFATVQLVAKAVEAATGAEGSFVAINNRVSQSVPHLHVHVVPRRKGDGLRGFFWPRQRYKDDSEMERYRQAIKTALDLTTRH